MARTEITTQPILVTGTTVVFEAANVDGNSVPLSSSGKTVLRIVNASGGALTVTLDTPGTVGGLAIANRSVSIANGVEKSILFDEVLRRSDDNSVRVDYSTVSSVTVAAVVV